LRLTFASIVALTAIGVAGVAHAATPPANDHLSGATPISSLPFQTTEDTSGTSTDSSDPRDCLLSGQQSPVATVWFTYTAATSATLQFTASANYSPEASIYDGIPSANTEIRCAATYGNTVTIYFDPVIGTKYRIMVGSGDNAAGSLTVSLVKPPRPANDDFANATSVTSLPFSDSQVSANATREVGEPRTPCVNDAPQHTTWYTFTAPADQTARITLNEYTGAYIYTGTSLTDLTLVDCNGGEPYYSVIDLPETAGTTYYLQVATDSFIGHSDVKIEQLIHDVTMTRLAGAHTAVVGSTRTLRAPVTTPILVEEVRVDLYRRLQGGTYALVGTKTKIVRPYRLVPFGFTVSFGPADVGIARFRAVATILHYKDAAPSDNVRWRRVQVS
jgi:hypothetical protein